MEQLEIFNGHIDQEDIDFENHKRGTNWVATVSFNPASPGSLDRDFWSKGSSSFKEVPDDLEKNDIIEIAADYTTYSGNRHHIRYYYQIIDIRDEELILEEAEKPCKKREKQLKERPLVNISDEDLLNELRQRNYNVDQINTLQKAVNY